MKTAKSTLLAFFFALPFMVFSQSKPSYTVQSNPESIRWLAEVGFWYADMGMPKEEYDFLVDMGIPMNFKYIFKNGFIPRIYYQQSTRSDVQAFRNSLTSNAIHYPSVYEIGFEYAFVKKTQTYGRSFTIKRIKTDAGKFKDVNYKFTDVKRQRYIAGRTGVFVRTRGADVEGQINGSIYKNGALFNADTLRAMNNSYAGSFYTDMNTRGLYLGLCMTTIENFTLDFGGKKKTLRSGHSELFFDLLFGGTKTENIIVNNETYEVKANEPRRIGWRFGFKPNIHVSRYINLNATLGVARYPDFKHIAATAILGGGVTLNL